MQLKNITAKHEKMGTINRYDSYPARIVVAGEAAMFTAQLADPQQLKAGMNFSFAGDNYKLLLNIIHWLDGILE